jgi:hypothetical protein
LEKIKSASQTNEDSTYEPLSLGIHLHSEIPMSFFFKGKNKESHSAFLRHFKTNICYIESSRKSQVWWYSYSGGRDRRIENLRSAWAKLRRPYLKKIYIYIHTKGPRVWLKGGAPALYVSS